MEYIILTASAVESNRLQQTRWVPSANLAPVSLMARGALRGVTQGTDLFYTDGALDALVRSASVEGREWEEWREGRHRVASVRPYEAWEYLNETTLEELVERRRPAYAQLNNFTHLEAGRPTLSYLDLLNFERRHTAAALRAHAADNLLRVAPGRVIVTESQEGNRVTIRASWHALRAEERKAPEWLINGLEAKPMAGV